MTGPRWLADVVGTAMLLSALYALVRSVTGDLQRRAGDYLPEVTFGLSGLALGGLLLPGLHIVRPGTDALIWIGLMVVLVGACGYANYRRAVAGIDTNGAALCWTLFLIPLATLYLLIAYDDMADSMSTSMPGMNMPAGSSMWMGSMTTPWPTLDLAVAFLTIGVVIVFIDRIPTMRARGQMGPAVLGIATALGASYLLVSYLG